MVDELEIYRPTCAETHSSSQRSGVHTAHSDKFAMPEHVLFTCEVNGDLSGLAGDIIYCNAFAVTLSQLGKQRQWIVVVDEGIVSPGFSASSAPKIAA
jgi:hypothetical protein